MIGRRRPYDVNDAVPRLLRAFVFCFQFSNQIYFRQIMDENNTW